MKRALVIAAHVIAWPCVAILALLLSTAYHLTLPPAREAARATLEAFVNGEIRGSLHIGHLRALDLGGAVAEHVIVRDEHGVIVIAARAVDVRFDLTAAMGGVLRFYAARASDVSIRLIEGAPVGDDAPLPTMVEAFLPRRPSPPGGPPGLHAIVDGIVLERVTARGDLPSFPNVRIESLSALGRMEFEEDFDMRFWSVRGRAVEPLPYVVEIDDLRAHIQGDVYRGTTLHAAVHTTRDRARVALRAAVPEGADEDADVHLDLLVYADPITPQSLREAGFELAERLRSPLRGYTRMTGPTSDLRVQGSLETEGGHVDLRVHLPEDGPTEVRVATSSLRLDSLVADLPPLTLTGGGTLLLPPTTDAPAADSPVAQIQGRVEPFTFEGYTFPAIDVRATLYDEHIDIAAAHARADGVDLEGDGRIDLDGRYDVRVFGTVASIPAEPNLRRLLPGLRGGAMVDARLRGDTASEGLPEIRGSLTLLRPSYQGTRASRMSVQGTLGGDTLHPTLAVRVDAQGLVILDYEVGRAQLSIHGRDGRYRFEGNIGREDQSVTLTASISGSTERMRVDVSALELHAGGQDWRGDVEAALIDVDREVSIGLLRLASGDQRLEAHGTVRFHGPDEIDASLQRFDLAALSSLFTDLPAPARGYVDANAVLRGDLESPSLLLEGAVHELSLEGLSGIEAAYAISYGSGTVDIDVSVDLGAYGQVFANGRGSLDPSLPPIEALRAGLFDIEAEIGNLDLRIVHATRASFPELQGVITGTVSATGSADNPAFDANLTGTDVLLLRSLPPVGIALDAHYSPGTLAAIARVDDSFGPLISIVGSAAIDLPIGQRAGAATRAVVRDLGSTVWNATVELPERRLADLPDGLIELSPWIPIATTLTAKLEVSSDERGDTRADLQAAIDSVDPFAACAEGPTRADLGAHLEDDRTVARLRVSRGEDTLVTATASADTPISTWLSQGTVPTFPVVRAEAHLDGTQLSNTPWLCANASGALFGDLVVEGLFGPSPSARAALRSEDLVLVDSPPMEISVEGEVGQERASVELSIVDTTGGVAEITAAMPILWSDTHPLPTLLEEAPFAIRAVLDRGRLAPILNLLPSVANADAEASGTLTLDGTLRDPRLEGAVSITQGRVTLIGPGQQLSNVRGELAFESGSLVIRDLTAEDSGGALHIDGSVGFDGIVPSLAVLSLRADRFPTRQEGSLLATLTGAAELRAEIRDSEIEARMLVTRMTVLLPDATTRTVQDLAPHPDIVVLGEQPVEEGLSEPFPIHLLVDARQPFWVRRSDFAALVSANLDVTYRDPDLFIGGYANLRRGFFEIFGKRFEVERGSLNFDGSAEMNPTVDLQANHMLDRYPGDEVQVRVTGRLTTPSVEFTTTHAGITDRGQIVALLLGVEPRDSGRTSGLASTSGEAAGQEAAGFLAGITAGILTLSARRELGELVPVIAIESGDQAFQSARVRVGFQVDSLVPKFMRSIVRGAYVEGIFTASAGSAASSDGSQPAAQPTTGVGVLLELQLPEDLVFTGTFTPPSSGGIDITWEP